MASRGHRLLVAILLAASAPTAFLACKREDPEVRALTARASQADEAGRRLRQLWGEQLRRLSLAGIRTPQAEDSPLLLTQEQKRALEVRVHREQDSSRLALLQEILAKDGELRALDDALSTLKAALPAPDIAKTHDSHYGLAARFLRGQGHSPVAARQILSQLALHDRLMPGFEVYHFYHHGSYNTWVSQGRAALSPQDLAEQGPDHLEDARDEALQTQRRLKRDLGLLLAEKQLIEAEIAAIQADRAHILEGQRRLKSENAQQAAALNALHYLVGVRDQLEAAEIITISLFGRGRSGRHWRDELFTQSLDLRTGTRLVIHARDLGLTRISAVSLVPESYLAGEHYRLSLSADRQTATVHLLNLPRFKNDKVVFSVTE